MAEQTCPLCGKPSPGGVIHAYHVPGGTPQPPGSSMTWGSISVVVGTIVGAILLIAGIGSALGGDDSSSGSSGSSLSSSSDLSSPDAGASDPLVERSCEIFRDIAVAAGDYIDSVPETRDRLRDLLNGYGVALPPDLQEPLRSLVGDLTVGDLGTAADDIARMDAACSAHGS